jgi:hypothetical protein
MRSAPLDQPGKTLSGDHEVRLLSMVLHDWDEAKNRALLRRSFEALPSGGAVVISELLVNDERPDPRRPR